MLLVVRAQKLPLAIDDDRAVERNPGHIVREREARHHVAVVCAGSVLQRTHRGAVYRLGQFGHVRADNVQLVACREQLGQHHEVGAFGSRLGDHPARLLGIRCRIAQHALELHQCQMHRAPASRLFRFGHGFLLQRLKPFRCIIS